MTEIRPDPGPQRHRTAYPAGRRPRLAVVLLTVVSRPRAQAQKIAFYDLLAQKLQQACGLSPDELIVSLVEKSDADWSFGRGRAQFSTQEL